MAIASIEVLESEFERFLDAMGIAGEDFLKGDTLDEFLSIKESILHPMSNGRLTINQSGEPCLVVRAGTEDEETLTFAETDGASLMSRKKGNKNVDEVTIAYGLAASMTGKNISFFANLQMRDVKVCLNLVKLFLA